MMDEYYLCLSSDPITYVSGNCQAIGEAIGEPKMVMSMAKQFTRHTNRITCKTSLKGHCHEYFKALILNKKLL